ncbi:PLP-dependent transferase [Thozetella sp. PMI_491]|nr:PLP-dependent transferase [Thozetella sp. PMI_491]
MPTYLSGRAARAIAQSDLPWRFAPRGTYDPDTCTDGLVSFGTAENTLVLDEIEAFVNKNVQIPSEAYTYRFSTGGGPRFPRALAVHLNEYFQPHEALTGAEIQITGAATAMHDVLAWSIGEPGDAILLGRPVYGRFELDYGNKSGLQIVYAETGADESFTPSVVDKFEEAFVSANAAGTNIRAVKIVNPNNPLGRCYPRGTLTAIMAFCQRHNIHFISDEVYGCSVFPNDEPGAVPFTSALAIDTTDLIDRNLVHVIYGLSKDFGVPGLRVGAIITRSEPIHQATKTVMRFHNPSGASIAIVTAMLEDREWCRGFVELTRDKLAGAFRHVVGELGRLGIQYVRGANAGFFVYIDLSPWLPGDAETPVHEREFALAQKLLDSGVFLHPGEEHSLRPGWFRVVYSQDPRVVTEGLTRLQRALKIHSA